MKLVLLFNLLVLGISYVTCGRSPVVIVPGTGGNQLQAKLTGKPSKPAWYCYSTTSSYFTLWLDIKSLLPPAINCWVDNMRLDWHMKDMTVANSPGVLTRTFDFGQTTSFETVDTLGLIKYIKPLADFLETLGYKRGKNIRGAPYDFRYSPDRQPDHYHLKLRDLIEETYVSNGNTPVTLLSHSYGCAMSLYFLSIQSQAWKSKYLKQWIPMSGVFAGTKQQVQLYAAGLLMGVPQAIVNPLTIRGEQRSSISNLYMLPAAKFWSKNDVIARTKSKTYYIGDIDQFLIDVGFPQGAIMRKHIVNSTALMDSIPGIPIQCFYGVIKKSTVETLEYDGGFPDKFANLIMGDGDGTVNIESLRLCGSFKSKQNESVTVTEVPNVDHTAIVSDKSVMSKIGQLLQD